MTDTDKRAYVSALRDSQARRTRRQIVAAASRLYASQGFAATTVDAIAAEAGVSRKTVFTSVGGKVALLKLAYDYTVAGDDEPIPMVEREGLQRIIAQADPYEQFRMYAEFVAAFGERTSALWLALRGAAEVDEEARELYQRWDRDRLEGMRDGPVASLVAKGVLRPDLTPDEAAAVLWILVDPALYHQLVVVAGWARHRFRDWLYGQFSTQLIRPRADPGGTPSEPAAGDTAADSGGSGEPTGESHSTGAESSLLGPSAWS